MKNKFIFIIEHVNIPHLLDHMHILKNGSYFFMVAHIIKNDTLVVRRDIISLNTKMKDSPRRGEAKISWSFNKVTSHRF